MKQIIRRLNEKQGKCHITELEDNPSLSLNDIIELVSKQPTYFKLESGYIHYYPPCGIVDRTSLESAIQNAYPKGIPHECLNMCYEFVGSDINELDFRSNIYIHRYGKTNRKVFYAPPLHTTSRKLQDIWNQVAGIASDSDGTGQFNAGLSSNENNVRKRKKIL